MMNAPLGFNPDLIRLRVALGAIRHHRERRNGDGAPDGLDGQNVPCLARVLAVASEVKKPHLRVHTRLTIKPRVAGRA